MSSTFPSPRDETWRTKPIVPRLKLPAHCREGHHFQTSRPFHLKSTRVKTSVSSVRLPEDLQLNSPDRWVLENVKNQRVIYVDVRQVTFPVRIGRKGTGASKSQTVKWLTDVACELFIQEFDFLTARERFTTIDICDRSGIRLMPDSLLCDLLDWIPKLHPVCTVMQCSDFAKSNEGYNLSLWGTFRHLLCGRCVNLTKTKRALVSLKYTDETLRDRAQNDIQNEDIVAATLLVTSEDMEKTYYFKKVDLIWEVEFSVDIERRMKFDIQVCKPKKKPPKKIKCIKKLEAVSKRLTIIKRMFAKRDESQLLDNFELEWNRSELQMFLRGEGYTADELSDLKDVMRDNYVHTSISFKAVCANVGESRWMTSAGFRALVKKSKICSDATTISEVWTTLNQGDVGVTQTSSRGVHKPDCNNMDRAEFLEALVRLSKARKKLNMPIAVAYKEMYDLYKKNAVGEEVVEIERYLSDKDVNTLFLKYERVLCKCFNHFASHKKGDSTIDIGEFMFFFEKLLGERVPKNCLLSRREIMGIFFQSQIIDESKEDAGEDEYELDKTEFHEAIVRTVHVVMRKISQMSDKDKGHNIPFDIPANFMDQLTLILEWIKMLSF